MNRPGARRFSIARGDRLVSGLAAGFVTEVAENGIYGDFAGDFSGCLTSHAIANYKNAIAGVVAEVIFIVGADASHVRPSRDFEQQSHDASTQK
jgi:hypothetical protein